MIETNVVESDISFLMSKTKTKKAETKFDVAIDKAEVMCKEMNLENIYSTEWINSVITTLCIYWL